VGMGQREEGAVGAACPVVSVRVTLSTLLPSPVCLWDVQTTHPPPAPPSLPPSLPFTHTRTHRSTPPQISC